MSKNPVSKNKIDSICVFCGSSAGREPVYAEAAAAMGACLSKLGIRLVYGGGSVGMMGVMADAVLETGGEVVGVIPECLAHKELLHPKVEQMRIVKDMHERKATMASLADGFIAMPGGLGTLEELFEVLTWAQLGIHQKPIGLLNVQNFFTPLVDMVEHTIALDFAKPMHRELMVVDEHVETLIETMLQHTMPAVRRWGQEDLI